jgi:hypothetical protein
MTWETKAFGNVVKVRDKIVHQNFLPTKIQQRGLKGNIGGLCYLWIVATN